MRSAFTLIEILVTMVLLTVIMGVVVPTGYKMLEQFTAIVDRSQAENAIQIKRMEAFSSATQLEMNYDHRHYLLRKNGMVEVHETK